LGHNDSISEDKYSLADFLSEYFDSLNEQFDFPLLLFDSLLEFDFLLTFIWVLNERRRCPLVLIIFLKYFDFFVDLFLRPWWDPKRNHSGDSVLGTLNTLVTRAVVYRLLALNFPGGRLFLFVAGVDHLQVFDKDRFFISLASL